MIAPSRRLILSCLLLLVASVLVSLWGLGSGLVPLSVEQVISALLGGAPRALAIVNGTLAGAIGLGLRLWLAGLAIWAIGHVLSVWAARRDPQFVDVARRHLKYPTWVRP